VAGGSAREREPETSRWAGLVSWLAAGFIRTLRATVRLRFHDSTEVRGYEVADRRFILAFWHRHLLLMPYAYRGRGISVMISRSQDGELIARTIERLGIHTARGSSSRDKTIRWMASARCSTGY